MITRRKDYSKNLPSRDARKMYIFCEGKGTEPDYFSFFEGLSTNLEVVIIPPENGTDPLKLKELARKKLLSEGGKYIMDYYANDSVWFVIDTDTWEEEGKISQLRDFCSFLNNNFPNKYSEVKAYKAWNVAQSNPCFEIWLYYHFFEDMPVSDNVDEYPSFKAFVANHIHGGFNFQRDQVRIQDAVNNARQNDRRSSDNTPLRFTTEVYELAEDIIPLVRQHLERLRGKM